jgi:hypothetical protein
MNKFIFNPAIPKVIVKELRQELKAYDWLIPDWCQRVYVDWAEQGSTDGTLITCQTSYEYRNARLTFYPQFLSEGDQKAEHIIHDLLHGFTSVLANYAYDTISLLVPPEDAPKLRESLLEELRIRHESMVQDLAHCLGRKLAPPK